jgi:hypothetical protein
MFSIAFSSLFGQDALNRRPAHAESVGNRARRLIISVHPLRQSSFRLVVCTQSRRYFWALAPRMSWNRAWRRAASCSTGRMDPVPI